MWIRLNSKATSLFTLKRDTIFFQTINGNVLGQSTPEMMTKDQLSTLALEASVSLKNAYDAIKKVTLAGNR